MRGRQLPWYKFETVRRLFEELRCTSLIALYLVPYFLMVVNLVDKVN